MSAHVIANQPSTSPSAERSEHPTARFTAEAEARGLAVATGDAAVIDTGGAIERLRDVTTSAGRVHPRYHINDLGRVCSQHPNLAAMPRPARAALVADDGWEFTGLAVHDLELHAYAFLSGDELLTRCAATAFPYRNIGDELGTDEHIARAVTQAALYGRPAASLLDGVDRNTLDRFADRFSAAHAFVGGGTRNIAASRRILRLAALTFGTIVADTHDAVLDTGTYAAAIRGTVAVFTHRRETWSSISFMRVHSAFCGSAARRIAGTPTVATYSGTDLSAI